MVLSPDVSRKLTAGDHAAIGAFAGTVEVTTLQPIIFVKYAVQEGRALPRNPLHYYRGFGVNVGTFAPITATQFGASRFAEGVVRKYASREFTQLDTIGCAAFGGAVSSLLSSPSELIQIQQQRTGKTLGDTLRSVVQNHGPLVLYRGFAPMLVRESVYTAAYLGLMPVLRTNLEASDVMKGVPASATLLISGVSAGMIGSFFSHPSDTIKTCQQAFLDIDKYPQYRSVSSTIAAKGVKKLMDGFGSRCLRQVIATLLLNVTKDLVGPRIAEMRKG